jgi:hypothetical protein
VQEKRREEVRLIGEERSKTEFFHFILSFIGISDSTGWGDGASFFENEL